MSLVTELGDIEIFMQKKILMSNADLWSLCAAKQIAKRAYQLIEIDNYIRICFFYGLSYEPDRRKELGSVYEIVNDSPKHTRSFVFE